MNGDEILILISAALSLIVLITYFVMTSNIGQIKRTLNRDRNHFNDYIKHLSFGNKEAALNSLNEFVWTHLKDVQLDKLGESERSKKYYKVKNDYEKYYKQIGAEFPKMLKYQGSSFILIQ